MALKTDKITEEEISDLIYSRGAKIDDYTFGICVHSEIEFDGRKCVEDYEDLPAYARCLVTHVFTNVINKHCWFKQCTGFSTQWPDMHDDNFNLRVLGQTQYQQIANYLTKLSVKRKLSKKNYKVDWLKKAESHLNNYVWPDDVGYDNGAWFKHSVDCYLCCYNDIFDPELDNLIDRYVQLLDQPTMIAIKMLYPDKETFLDKMYLSTQNLSRSVILDKFINTVMTKVWNTVSDSYIRKLYKINPVDVLKKNKNWIIFKEPIEFKKRNTIKPGWKHTPKDSYKRSDFQEIEDNIFDLWVGCSYGLEFKPDNYKPESIIEPFILKSLEFKPEYNITEKSLNFTPYMSPNDLMRYMSGNRYESGNVIVKMTFESQWTGKSHVLLRDIYGGGSYYTILKHKVPYRYPNTENTFVKNEIDRIFEELCERYDNFIKEYISQNNTKLTGVKELNGLKWHYCNITTPYKYNSAPDYVHEFGQVLQMIPNGWRLPTSDEVVELLKNYPARQEDSINKDLVRYNIGGIIVTIKWRFYKSGFWTSDTLSGKMIDPIKVVVSTAGKKEIVDAHYGDHILLLVKDDN